MTKKRAEYRNEVKTRLDDTCYDALQMFKQLNGIESDSAALARIVKLSLFGVVGTLPTSYLNVSAEAAQMGTAIL